MEAIENKESFRFDAGKLGIFPFPLHAFILFMHCPLLTEEFRLFCVHILWKFCEIILLLRLAHAARQLCSLVFWMGWEIAMGVVADSGISMAAVVNSQNVCVCVCVLAVLRLIKLDLLRWWSPPKAAICTSTCQSRWTLCERGLKLRLRSAGSYE